MLGRRYRGNRRVRRVRERSFRAFRCGCSRLLGLAPPLDRCVSLRQRDSTRGSGLARRAGRRFHRRTVPRRAGAICRNARSGRSRELASLAAPRARRRRRCMPRRAAARARRRIVAHHLGRRPKAGAQLAELAAASVHSRARRRQQTHRRRRRRPGRHASRCRSRPSNARDRRSDIERIARSRDEYGAGEIVVGDPVTLSGERGIARATRWTLRCGSLRGRFAGTIHRVDERLTTAQATKTLIAADVSRKRRKTVVDRMAAALILETFLAGVRTHGQCDSAPALRARSPASRSASSAACRLVWYAIVGDRSLPATRRDASSCRAAPRCAKSRRNCRTTA